VTVGGLTASEFSAEDFMRPCVSALAGSASPTDSRQSTPSAAIYVPSMAVVVTNAALAPFAVPLPG